MNRLNRHRLGMQHEVVAEPAPDQFLLCIREVTETEVNAGSAGDGPRLRWNGSCPFESLAVSVGILPFPAH